MTSSTTPNSPFSGPWFVLALVEIRRLVVQIKAIVKDDLIPLRGLADLASLTEIQSPPCFPGQ